MAARIRPICIARIPQIPFRQRCLPILTNPQLQQALLRRRPLSTTSATLASTEVEEPLQTYTATATSTSTTPTEELQPEHQADASSTQFESLAYHVHRTPSQQLPIYHLAKRGGNKHQTRIRKVSGNLEALKDDLKKELRLGDKEIAINSVNGHIVLKGWKKVEVARFLEEKRF